ncbi:MAG: hypothetical protein RIQ53_2873 [Pseudomonadota bacterium]|jgi:hypothetical protein
MHGAIGGAARQAQGMIIGSGATDRTVEFARQGAQPPQPEIVLSPLQTLHFPLELADALTMLIGRLAPVLAPMAPEPATLHAAEAPTNTALGALLSVIAQKEIDTRSRIDQVLNQLELGQFNTNEIGQRR